ncbi:uncharacterized protein NFIA_095590 [Aspergillus fischeri NRRL 181]|uniref:Uncharacterized protein n=1 Tax=Neosartorya fischeri (strain ATCC 1020 / DSM 3700 / CBS 544.65 / FGSC A1164 / JCM 1740 / NRRL 181 / WB 181) TaxID=331117 RepID=A1DAP9_NEOFI|nr:uncharacterized protein NFIA_095590 [Aspergillus fischeri NRRL 181]EAW19939.1 hypothetical protein NFIA_095590 [Aspergillus fischeri NRRL 181]
MASATISQQHRIFYCYASTTQNGEKKENTITFEAKDHGFNETKYIMQGIKPDNLRSHSPPGVGSLHTCIQTFISPITPGNPDIDSITGRPLTHRLASGAVVTEVPVTGYWRPRKFEFKGRQLCVVEGGEQTRLYDSSRTVEKRKSSVTGFETVKPALASESMPFWPGLFMSRCLEVRVAEGVEEALLEVIPARALTEIWVAKPPRLSRRHNNARDASLQVNSDFFFSLLL